MDAVSAKNGAPSQVLRRIEEALRAATYAITPFLAEKHRVEYKSGRDPVTEADRIANRTLRDVLLREDEGWLSEESVDDLDRLQKERLWVVDPIDGTREFISGIPEWCISVGLVENGRAVAGGICNPVTGETFLGRLGEGVRLNGTSVCAGGCQSLQGAVVLASRSEVARGEWDCFRGAPFVTRPMGSVAYKLALVAAGRADATWTRSPKHEWDIAAGSALVEAAGGLVRNINGSELRFNNPSPLFPGLLACSPELELKINSWLSERTEHTGR
jgi:myo-inositol-1(or 4)-monophosphatase